MPRVNPVSPAEKEVGARLRDIRKSQLLTGTAFAFKHGIAAGNLAKYENGYVPLPWSIGDRICAREGISQRWLATGKLPRTPWFAFDPSHDKLIPQRAHFTAAYRDFLAPAMRAIEKSYRDQTQKKVSKGKEYDPGFLGWFDGTVGANTYLLPLYQYLVESWFNALPEDERFLMLRHLEAALEEFLRGKEAVLPGVDLSLEMIRMTNAFFEHQKIKEEHG